MAAVVDISLLGDKKLEKQLRKLPNRVEKKVVRQALRAGAKPILAAAKANVATMTAPQTGRLAKGLQLRAIRRSRGRMGYRVATKPREFYGIEPDDKWFYPAVVEYGHPKAAARPFLRSAFDSHERSSFAIVKREIGVGVEREAKKT